MILLQSLTRQNIGFIILDLNAKLCRSLRRLCSFLAAGAPHELKYSSSYCILLPDCHNLVFCLTLRSVPESVADVRGLQRGDVPALFLWLPEERARHHGHEHPSLQAACMHRGRHAGGDRWQVFSTYTHIIKSTMKIYIFRKSQSILIVFYAS